MDTSTGWSNALQLRIVHGAITTTAAASATATWRRRAGERPTTGTARSTSRISASVRVSAARPTKAPSTSARSVVGRSTSRSAAHMQAATSIV